MSTAPPIHTYGPTCHLTRTVTSKDSHENDDSPPLKAQFFYTSPLPIDDPLSAIPAPADSASKSSKHPPRPFSAFDNSALEEAWRNLASEQDYRHHQKLRNSRLKPLTKAQAERRATIINDLSYKHSLKHAAEERAANITSEEAGANESPKTKLSGGDVKSKAATQSSTVMGIGCECCPECSNDSCAATSSSELIETQREALGNPWNPHCDDAHHAPFDSSVPVCCSDLPKDVKNAQPIFSGVLKRHESQAYQELLIRDIMSKVFKEKEAAAKLSRAKAKKHDNGPAQGDAADEFPFSKDIKRYIKKGKEVAASGEASPALAPQGSVSNLTIYSESMSSVSKEKNPFDDPKQKSIVQTTNPKPHEGLAIDPAKNKDVGPSKGKLHSLSMDQVLNESLNASGNADAGTTGAPFRRAPSRSSTPTTTEQSVREETAPSDVQHSEPGQSIHVHRCKAHKKKGQFAEIPVGVSRLHNVQLPQLQMTPIYWSPVHDIAAVTRGTWFYKDTMYPVEATVANQLEMGYKDLRPWSQTWQDEINSAVQVGAAGEEKVSHKLWPDEVIQLSVDRTKKNQEPEAMVAQPDYVTDPYCAARCFHREVAASGSIEPTDTPEKLSKTAEIIKRYPTSHVIYKDASTAFILKPSLQPSQYFGRRPLAKIKKNIAVGVQVVRGFDWRAWDKLHPSKKTAAARTAEQTAPVANTTTTGVKSGCPACRLEENRPQVTDLVLVVHGIGQKLSERMESFHFTHAINAFRRSINVELSNEAVRKVLRDKLGGVMVLPVNWRQHLSFEEGGPAKPGDKAKEWSADDFSLKDITPDTIPAVRSLISDVLLDIPYYLSQHKAKMVEALITEANRVYRLWCKNNPDFQQSGRIHIIAHSLGSAMALDVLSKQPTSVPLLNIASTKAQKKFFEFNTTNLFFAGSPAGFFLLLDKGKLIPRYGRNKPDADIDDDKGDKITGQCGTFGCLAVDNLYNIIHYNDPIAYRLNATVDPMYAATLKAGEVPSSTTGWLETFHNAFKILTPGGSATTEPIAVGQLAPKPMVARLPSQLEMEVHDFTREELAEKKFYLLNDNGQIDYFLATGGGPLEIQYLNMLGAHSSYWTSPDFIRMLVTEVGRKPGKTNTMPNMRATKVPHKIPAKK